jgi:hypothetical protein
MTALHVWLIAVGGLLALGPVLLHLLLQDKPKRLPFPALRFVIAKQQFARRSFRLRHWLLLTLRVAVIGLAAVALSRPAAATALFGSSLLLGATVLSGVAFGFLALFWRHQVKSQQSKAAEANATTGGSRPAAASFFLGPWPVWLLVGIVVGHLVAAGWLAVQLLGSDSGPVLTGKQPVAAVIVVDTSPRMQYRQDNRTRLERAQELAAAVVKLLPPGSQLSVVDSSPDPVGLSLDLAAAQQQINSLQITYQSEPLPNRIRAALGLLADSPLEGRELFVLTDMSRPSWTTAAGTPSRLEIDDNVVTYLIDVGAKTTENWSIDQWELPTPSITPGGLIQVRGSVGRKVVMSRGENLPREVAADQAQLRALERAKTERGTDETSGGEPAAELALDDADSGSSVEEAAGRDLPAEGRAVRLLIEKPEEGRPVYRNGETLVPSTHWERLSQVNLAPGQSMEVSFSVPDLPEGVHHGWLEIDGGDPLGFDNRRFFTITVQPAWRALLVTGPGVSDANFLEAIAPEGVREKGQAVFDCQTISTEQLREYNLNDFRVVFFLNPGPLSEEQWNQTYRYVVGGGSAGFFLGHNGLSASDNRSVPHASFNGQAAQQVLPGVLEDPWRRPDGLLFEPTAWDHPVFSRMQPLRTTLMWGRLPIFMHFGLRLSSDETADQERGANAAAPAGAAGENPPPDAGRDDRGSPQPGAAAANEAVTKTIRVLATFSNNMPALVEATVGQGQVLLLTTPVTDPTRPDDGRRPWNSFSVGDGPSFTYWLLATEIARHLATAKSAQLNGLVGDSFVLPNDQPDAPNQYALYPPENQEPIEVAVERGRIYLDFNDRPGAYRLRGVNDQQKVQLRGFSVNVPAAASDLSRIGKPQLDGWFGRGRYAVAEDEDQIARAQGAGRVGLEFYPSLVRLLAVAFLAELLLANWFYQESPKKRTAHEIVTGSPA